MKRLAIIVKNLKLKSKTQIFIFGLAVCIIAFLILPLLNSSKRKGPQEVIAKIPVSTVIAEGADLNEYLFYVGDIKAEAETEVYPKVTGKIIEKLAKEGDTIGKGEILAYIDRDEIGFQFEKAPVESPIDGVVGRIYVDIGTAVSPQSPAGLVVNMDMVKVKMNVVEKDLPKVKRGQLARVKVDAYPDEVFEGLIEKVSPVVDLSSRTAMVEIIMPNLDHRLKPGMFARINILIKEKKDVLVIPRDAIIREDSSNYIFIVGDDNQVHRQRIETGLHENNKFEVISGLNEGQLVVTMGNARLKEGDIVELVDVTNVENIKEHK